MRFYNSLFLFTFARRKPYFPEHVYTCKDKYFVHGWLDTIYNVYTHLMSNEHSSLVNKTVKQNDDILLDENKVLKNITGIQFTDLGNDHDKATLWAVVMIMGIAVFVVSGLMVSLFWKRRKVAIITDNASEKPDTLNMTPTRRLLEKTELDNVRRDKYRSSSLGNIYSSSPRTRAEELLLDTRASHRHSII